MEKGLISIIVPVYNAEKFIEDTIKTVLNQTYEKWELILVDDCSRDNSKKIIEEFTQKDSRIKYFCQDENGGPALARNKGVDIARGEFLCYLDADDIWDNDKLEKQIKFMKEKDCAFSYHSYEYASERAIPTGKKVVAKDNLTYGQALKNNIISTITVMFNLNKIDKKMIEMPNLKYVEDTATWWHILKNGYIAYGIPDTCAYYRRIPKTHSSNKLRTQKHLWDLYRKEEKLGIVKSFYYITWKNIHAIIRRL